MFIEILPFGVLAFDESDFLLSGTTLELFFSIDCCLNVFRYLKVNEFTDVVFTGEAGNALVFVFPNSFNQIAGNTSIEDCVPFIGEDVDI